MKTAVRPHWKRHSYGRLRLATPAEFRGNRERYVAFTWLGSGEIVVVHEEPDQFGRTDADLWAYRLGHESTHLAVADAKSVRASMRWDSTAQAQERGRHAPRPRPRPRGAAR
jgi:hypothetical protein